MTLHEGTDDANSVKTGSHEKDLNSYQKYYNLDNVIFEYPLKIANGLGKDYDNRTVAILSDVILMRQLNKS